MRVVNCGMCREGMIGVLFRRLHKCSLVQGVSYVT